MDEETKRCGKCETVKPVGDFSRDKRARDGRQSRCKACERKHYRQNADRIRERQREYREQNADRIREQIAADRARLRPDGTKACVSCGEILPFEAFYADRREADGLRRKCRDCNNRAVAARHRAAHLPLWVERDAYTCYVCGGPAEEIEHIIPLSRGGEDAPYNTLPACTACNRGAGGKHDRPLLEFLAERFDLHALAHLECVGPGGESYDGLKFGDVLSEVGL